MVQEQADRGPVHAADSLDRAQWESIKGPVHSVRSAFCIIQHTGMLDNRLQSKHLNISNPNYFANVWFDLERKKTNHQWYKVRPKVTNNLFNYNERKTTIKWNHCTAVDSYQYYWFFRDAVYFLLMTAFVNVSSWPHCSNDHWYISEMLF